MTSDRRIVIVAPARWLVWCVKLVEELEKTHQREASHVSIEDRSGRFKVEIVVGRFFAHVGVARPIEEFIPFTARCLDGVLKRLERPEDFLPPLNGTSV